MSESRNLGEAKLLDCNQILGHVADQRVIQQLLIRCGKNTNQLHTFFSVRA